MSKSDEHFGLGLTFGREKACQNRYFSAECEFAFRIVNTMVCETFGSSEVRENYKKKLCCFEETQRFFVEKRGCCVEKNAFPQNKTFFYHKQIKNKQLKNIQFKTHT